MVTVKDSNFDVRACLGMYPFITRLDYWTGQLDWNVLDWNTTGLSSFPFLRRFLFLVARNLYLKLTSTYVASWLLLMIVIMKIFDWI